MLLLFLVPFTPRASALNIGGMAFSFTRLALLTIGIAFAVRIIVNRRISQRFATLIIKERAFFLLVSLFLVKLTSTIVNQGAGALPYVFDDFATSALIFAVFYTHFNNFHYQKNIEMIMFSAICLIFALSLVEILLGKTLVSFVANQNIIGIEHAVSGSFRDGQYRIQALFDNTLLLSEFIVLAAPFGLAAFSFNAPNWKRTLAVSVLLTVCFFLVYKTASRSGMAILTFSVLLFIHLKYRKKIAKTVRFLMATSGVVLIFVLIILQFPMLLDLAHEGTSQQLYNYGELERSKIVRAAQYLTVFENLGHSPLIGFGVSQNLLDSLPFLNTLDSYWLRTALESGVIGLGLLVAFIALFFWRISVIRKLRSDAESQLIFVTFSVFLVGYVLYMFFLSIPTNNVIFFALAGYFFSASREMNKQVSR